MKPEQPISDLLEAALADAQAAGADAADAVHIAATDLSVSQRLGLPEEMERAESEGIGLRVFVGERYAISSLSDLSREALREGAERAVAMARASIDDPYSRLAAPEEWGEPAEALDLYDPQEPPIEWMREQCRIAEDAARAPAGITNSEGAEMSVSQHRFSLASTAGLWRSAASSSWSLSVSVLGGSGEAMERDYAYAMARHRADLPDATLIGFEAAQRTLKRLNPKKQSTQQVPVIFEPRIAKSLLSYFAQAISGAAVARGTSFLKDKRGQPVFAPGITIIDDPHRKRGLASRPFDAEGLANPALTLVEDGVLHDWLLDLRSAAQLGLRGNGRAARGLGSAPSPSSTNLYMQPGSDSPQALMSDIAQGFYVTEAFGMGVNLVTGDYSQGASGFWIENGEIAYPVSELTLAGHLAEMFATLRPADDLRFDYATNAPTLRIERMTVAGV